MSEQLCREYDEIAVVARTAAGPRWDVQPKRCHVATELLYDPEAVEFITGSYALSPGCRGDVVHADLRAAHLTTADQADGEVAR